MIPFKFLLAISVSLFLGTACTQINSVSDNSIIKSNDSITNLKIVVSKNINKKDTLLSSELKSILLFKAYGSEPGWLSEIYTDKLKLIVNYGKDSVFINDTFTDLQNENGFNYIYQKQLNGKAISLSFNIKNKQCTAESSGEQLDRTVTFILNNTQFKGCGNFIK